MYIIYAAYKLIYLYDSALEAIAGTRRDQIPKQAEEITRLWMKTGQFLRETNNGEIYDRS